MISKKFIQKQKQILTKEKERLEKKVKELKKYPEYGRNEDDNAQEMADYQSNLSLEEQVEFLIDKVEAALKAIENGTYGKCKKCKEMIEEGRLEVMPYAEVCVTCKDA